MEAVLALSDGTVMRGRGFGAEGVVSGEVVFNTSLVGYEESLTDPSYRGQILTLTYPLVGNYGVRADRFESGRIQVEGFVVREVCVHPQHRTAVRDLHSFLVEHRVPGISGVDTRRLTKIIRMHGVMNGALAVSLQPIDEQMVLQRASEAADISTRDLLPLVTRQGAERFGKGGTHRLALIDCGVKQSIIDNLVRRNLEVVVLPHTAIPDQVVELEPHAIFLSNGPGDPEKAVPAIHLIRELHTRYPVFGICLGIQVLALALGGRTYKLKFGHRGTNQPVKELSTGKVMITSQNHGFAVDADSLRGTDLEVSHLNLNDGSVEGIRHARLPIFGFQAHPEARPGPWDMQPWFDEVSRVLKEGR